MKFPGSTHPVTNDSRGIAGYEQINGGPWFSINVTDTSGPPNATTPKEGGNYGIEGGNLPVSTGIWESVVEVSFSEFSGEADGTWYLGDNSWSIQLNTNFFYGNNDHWDMVQFVFQNKLLGLTGYYSTFGIWNINTDTQNYNDVSVGVPIQTLSTGIVYSVQGYVQNGELYAGLGISNYNTNTFYNYVVQAPDMYGLASNWNSASGTILGAANGSTAWFTSPTDETTIINVFESYPYQAYGDLDYGTEEMNNLNQGSVTTSNPTSTWFEVSTFSYN